jgi:hypothetical protein
MAKTLIKSSRMEERYGLRSNYLAKLRITGEGPAFLKIGNLIFYEEDRVEAWLESKRRTSTSDPGTEPEAA